ncbi:MAG TPA: putative transporter small subunit [Candidatus Corynebacterium avicola]|uniref:Transporter small subunit n=1 Tax=Candidatus Corynebacterium avicola TaxID=2838527 RepID=A0A9D1RLP2_9CORY|nr:putative transporter small subunit [Candidatus Corynebacterium avicola]
MSPILLTAYFLIWPVGVAVIMAIIARGFARDARKARESGTPII